MPQLIPERRSRHSPLLSCLASSTLGLLLSLAGCGGGDPQTGTSTDPQAVAGSGDSVESTTGRAQALATDAGTAATGWTPIANENESFSVQGTQTVRYGSGSSFITLSVTGSGQCTNAFFGNDPLFGTVKHCEVAAAAAPPVAGWTAIANEGQAFSVSGTQTVRYGSGSTFISQSVTGSGQCTNAFFGNDPVFGIAKHCEVASAAPPPPVDSAWTTVAGEGQAFSVSGTQTVRYGSGSSYITLAVTGSGQCTNAFFGNDPIFGVAKHCDVQGGTSAPPPVVGAVPAVCTPPVSAIDTSGTTASVGNGTPASCTESALRAAINGHDVVKFNCGAAPATIAVTSQIDLPTNRNLVIDGGNRVTLDGGHSTRILSMIQNNYRTNHNGLTLQHITLANGKAAGTGFVAQDPNQQQCAWGYAGGAGGAIEVRDARLHVIDAVFSQNAAATPGPDVGGGAIYLMGSLDATIVGSRFIGNSGANGGALGLLQTNGTLVNNVFDTNTANGIGYHGPNTDLSKCPGVAYQGQDSAGGDGGAVVVDGSDDTDLLVCGVRFTNNTSSELGGALARTPNGVGRRTTIDRSTFEGNKARQAGALFMLNSAPLDIIASTFNNNSALSFGAAQIERGQVNVVNSTFNGNRATQGVGGALLLGSLSSASSIRNVTFANNLSNGGSGYFSAAIFGQLNFPVDNTVFANNLTQDPGSPMQCTFAPATGSSDLQWPVNHVVGGGADNLCVQGIAFADPLLGALADNGGPTATLLPAGSSPLRKAGHNCPTTDQRGQPRNTASCTIGAVE